LQECALLSLPFVAQTPGVPTLDRQPNQRVVLHNDSVKVFIVEVSPGDSIILHYLDKETVATAVGDQPGNYSDAAKKTPSA
jgi:hypothetical protein